MSVDNINRVLVCFKCKKYCIIKPEVYENKVFLDKFNLEHRTHSTEIISLQELEDRIK